jgi:Flp pilus assembly protein TadB
MDPRSLVPALLAGAALLLALPDPGRGLGRLRAPAPRAEVVHGPLGRLLAGRSDAPPLAQRAWLGAVAGGAACLATTRLLPASPAWLWCAWPLVSAAAALVPGWAEPRSTRERRRRLVLETPQALELMSACLAAGMPPRQACAAVAEAFEGPVAEDLGLVLRSVELGMTDAQAWRTLGKHPQLGPAAWDLARSAESGTVLVAALRGHAAAARDRRRAALQQAARAVGVRSVLPLTICFLPAFLLLGIVPTVASAVLHAFH